MKSILPITIILLASSFAFVSCKKRDQNDYRLVGIWRLSSSSDGTKSYTFDSSFLSVEFNRDMSCQAMAYTGDKKTTRYQLENETLYLSQKVTLLGFDIDSSTIALSGNTVTFHKTGTKNDFVFVRR